ncbi:MAG: hypothetical protein O2954_02990 [bacterium]|nr:hypothetical protein [bacterium]
MVEESQRLMDLFHGHHVDRPPFWEPWFHMDHMLETHYGGSYLSMAEHLGHAAVPIGYIGTGANFVNRREIAETGVWYDGGTLKNIRQLQERPEPDFEHQRTEIEPKRQQCARAGRACWLTLQWCFHALATGMGLEAFACACYDHPDFIREAMEWVEARNRTAIRELISHIRPDFLLLDGDCAYKTGPMIAPTMLADFCLEPTRKTLALVAELGIPCAFHTDGKLDTVIPLLLDLGIVAVHGCEKQANDLGHLVDTFGESIVLCGNMDVVFLAVATPDEVCAETLRMLQTGAAKNRFIAGCNTSPLNYIPAENYYTMAETIRTFHA